MVSVFSDNISIQQYLFNFTYQILFCKNLVSFFISSQDQNWYKIEIIA